MDNPEPADPDAMYRRSAPIPPALPSISDYWPDAPHRIGPPADHYTDEPTEASVDALRRSGSRDRGTHDTVAEPPVRARSRRPAALAAALVAVLVAAAALAGITLSRQSGRDPVTVAPEPQARPTDASAPDAPAPEPSLPAAPQPIELQTTAPSSAPARPNFLSAPARDRDKASFELVSDAALIDLRAAELGDDLYRIATPQDSGVLPRAQTTDAGVRLFLDDNGERGDAAVTVLLNAEVRWSMRITGGVKNGVFDLRGAEVSDLDFAGGAARIDLTLPRPDGTLPIRLSGGVNRFEVATDKGVPVRVRTRRGAGQVKLDGRTDDGVARGASFLSPDWAGSRNRIDLDAVAGVGTLRVGND